MKHLIAYDIAGPRRLRRVAAFFERRALRCQKSVFLAQASEAGVVRWLDVVQAWKLAAKQPPLGRARGTPSELYPAAIVVAQRLGVIE